MKVSLIVVVLALFGSTKVEALRVEVKANHNCEVVGRDC
jgi:hypothetical protein